MISKSPLNDNHPPHVDVVEEALALDIPSLERFAELLASYLVVGDVVCLSGPLGAGKTTLTQSICRALGVTEPVTSPTFTLINEYMGRLPIVHVDAYRVPELTLEDTTSKLMPLDELMARHDSVFVIEWAEFIPEIEAMATWKLDLSYHGDMETLRQLLIREFPEGIDRDKLAKASTGVSK